MLDLPNPLYIFDFDDTLASSDALVYIMDPEGNTIPEREMTSGEYADPRHIKHITSEEKRQGYLEDFSDFDTGVPGGIPIDSTIQSLKTSIGSAGIQNVVILTARSNSGPVKKFLQDCCGISGIQIAAISSAEATAKARFVTDRVLKNNHDEVHVFEDSISNIKAIESAVKGMKGVEFFSTQVTSESKLQSMNLLKQFIKETLKFQIMSVDGQTSRILEVCGGEKAQDIMAAAEKAHHGQLRRDGTEYIKHPIAVANIVSSYYPGDNDLCAAALLHDTLEDAIELGNFKDEKELIDAIKFAAGEASSERIVNIVRSLTHSKSTPYSDYVLTVAADADALKIKLADMLHNLISSPSPHQAQKYQRALQKLEANTGGIPSGISEDHWNDIQKAVSDAVIIEQIVKRTIRKRAV